MGSVTTPRLPNKVGASNLFISGPAAAASHSHSLQYYQAPNPPRPSVAPPTVRSAYPLSPAADRSS